MTLYMALGVQLSLTPLLDRDEHSEVALCVLNSTHSLLGLGASEPVT